MPIRMVEDEPNNNSSNQTNNNSTSNSKQSFSSGSGLSGSLGNILGALLPFLIKKPKILIPVLIVGGLVWYFFLR